MKIAVISDIHANKLALSAVLDDIFSENVDEIWCLGDIAMAGYDPNFAIEKVKYLLSEESPVKTRCIFGNTDALIHSYSEELFEKVLAANSCMAYALQDDVKIIKPENIEFLKTLPQNEKILINGISFYLCHGSPRRVDEDMHPELPLDTIEEMITPCEGANVVLCGHTHIPCGFQLASGQTVLNVGSVGRPLTPDKRAVWAFIEVLSGSDCEIVHKFVEYDNKTASEKICKRGFKEADILAGMLLEREMNEV
ncbi:phosphoesterase MJ0936 family [Candidatus Gastranaerophilus sp. (ex Termes propinquus)]|nr:phosphoesterase MJ0936 family [Candidatus Gastranaerophilus sp. (ex Termes propinquus)]